MVAMWARGGGDDGGVGLPGRPPGRVVEPVASLQVSGPRGAVRGADSLPPQWGDVVSGGRVGRRGLEALRSQLSQRDLAVVASVERFKMVRSRHVEALHFFDHATALTAARTARRTLERLVGHRVLTRLGRRIGGVRAGSAGFVYALGPVGHRLLRDDATRRWREPSEAFVNHTLAIADLAVAVITADREDVTELVDLETEPTCWRAYTTLAGAATVRPDLYLVTARGDTEWSWFIEIDLGTESATAIARKARVYNDYYNTGIEVDRRGVFPKVLFVADTHRRAGLVKRAIANTSRINRALFAVTTNNAALAIVTGAGQ